MDKFKRKEIRKKRPIKTTWYDWFINHIFEPLRKTVGSFKDKVVSLFKTNTPKSYGTEAVY